VNRFKQWAFFQIMAWCSLFRPKIGQEMIDAAEFGAAEKAHRKHIDAIMGLGQRVARPHIPD